MTVKKFETIENGLRLSTGVRQEFICLDPDFCPENEEGFTRVTVRNGYGCVNVFLPGTTTNAQAALDIAVDFLLENDVAFEHCDYAEAIENDLVNKDTGEVIDMVCAGNEGIYLPSDGVHIGQHEELYIAPSVC